MFVRDIKNLQGVGQKPLKKTFIVFLKPVVGNFVDNNMKNHS